MAVPVVAVAMIEVVSGIRASSVSRSVVLMIMRVVMCGVSASSILTLAGCMGVRGMFMRMVMRLLQLLQIQYNGLCIACSAYNHIECNLLLLLLLPNGLNELSVLVQ